jgi:hypothetical protein
MNGDQNSLAVFAAAVIIFAVAAIFGLINALFVHPWLLGCIALAIIAYILAKRAERRERGQATNKATNEPGAINWKKVTMVDLYSDQTLKPGQQIVTLNASDAAQLAWAGPGEEVVQLQAGDKIIVESIK